MYNTLRNNKEVTEMEMPERSNKRPVGWSKPYWARTGIYATVTLVSVLVSLVVVKFGCGVLLRAAINAAPWIWRVVEVALDLLITVGVAWYFGTLEGYQKRTANRKICVGGGFLFILSQSPLALVFHYAAGPLAGSVARLLYFANQPDYAANLESPPPLLVVGCMLVAEACVLIPTVTLAEQSGAKAYEKERLAIIQEAAERQESAAETLAEDETSE